MGIPPAENTCEPSDASRNGSVSESCNWLKEEKSMTARKIIRMMAKFASALARRRNLPVRKAEPVLMRQPELPLM